MEHQVPFVVSLSNHVNYEVYQINSNADICIRRYFRYDS
jgi:hypothetical protein